jgi:hypothetical protein
MAYACMREKLRGSSCLVGVLLSVQAVEKGISVCNSSHTENIPTLFHRTSPSSETNSCSASQNISTKIFYAFLFFLAYRDS